MVNGDERSQKQRDQKEKKKGVFVLDNALDAFFIQREPPGTINSGFFSIVQQIASIYKVQSCPTPLSKACAFQTLDSLPYPGVH
jgi:hypothetical protein